MSRQRLMAAAVVLAAGAAAVVLAAGSPDAILAGDPAEYRRKVAAVLEGGLPYLDVPFEHLPVMLVPMLAAWGLGGWVSQPVFIVVFALLMTLAMAGATIAVDEAGARLRRAGALPRWLLVTMPLMPLVVFRNDPVAVLLAAVAVLGIIVGERWWTAAAGLGAFAKVWPAALGMTAVRRGRTAAGTAVAAAGALALGLTFLPGFTTARRALGIHAETVVGALLGLARVAGGEPAGVVVTTAAYLRADASAAILNAVVGLVVVGVGVHALVRSQDVAGALAATGCVVAGVILTSPLFSLQYVVWLAPFVALSRRRSTLVVAAAAGVLTTWLAWRWSPALFETTGMYLWLTVRNLLVVVAALSLAAEGRERPAMDP